MAKKNYPKAVGKKFVAQLDLPEPLPPPKSKKDKEPILQQSVQQRNTCLAVHSPASSPLDLIQTTSASSVEPTMPSSLPHLSNSRKLTHSKHPFGTALAKEKEKRLRQEEDGIASDVAPIKILAQSGTILMRPDKENWPKLTHHAHDPSDLQASFRRSSHFLKADFLNRLTTSSDDGQTLIQLGRGQTSSELERDALYEILIRDNTGTQLKISLDASQKSAYSIKKPDRIIGEALSHFPMHVYDARFLLVELGLESDTTSSELVKDIIMSMETDQKAPSFRANVPLKIRVEQVRAKRTFACDVDGLRFLVTQVQILGLESLEGRQHNFRALVGTEEDMVAEQRLWWEASLETFDLEQADLLQAKVNEMVTQMDAIGLDNKGPVVRRPGHDGEVSDEPVIPFW